MYELVAVLHERNYFVSWMKIELNIILSKYTKFDAMILTGPSYFENEVTDAFRS